jgi:hypothetical protein
MLNKFSQ